MSIATSLGKPLPTLQGALIAYEDHGVRNSYAALAMQQAAP